MSFCTTHLHVLCMLGHLRFANQSSRKYTTCMPKYAPDHYRNLGFSVVDVAKSWGLGFELFTSLKYLARAGKKSGESITDDLVKCVWYIMYYVTQDTEDADYVVSKMTKRIDKINKRARRELP